MVAAKVGKIAMRFRNTGIANTEKDVIPIEVIIAAYILMPFA